MMMMIVMMMMRNKTAYFGDKDGHGDGDGRPGASRPASTWEDSFWQTGFTSSYRLYNNEQKDNLDDEDDDEWEDEEGKHEDIEADHLHQGVVGLQQGDRGSHRPHPLLLRSEIICTDIRVSFFVDMLVLYE